MHSQFELSGYFKSLEKIARKKTHVIYSLVGGFNLSEKYSSKWESSPNRAEHKKCLTPTPSHFFCFVVLSQLRLTTSFFVGQVNQKGVFKSRLFWGGFLIHPSEQKIRFLWASTTIKIMFFPQFRWLKPLGLVRNGGYMKTPIVLMVLGISGVYNLEDHSIVPSQRKLYVFAILEWPPVNRIVILGGSSRIPVTPGTHYFRSFVGVK